MKSASRFYKTGMMAVTTFTLFGMLLAGCGGSPSKEGASPVGSNTAKPAATDTASPATLPEVKLTWYFVGGWPQPEQDLVFAEVNKVLKAKINATVDFKPITWGDYDQKMQVVIASGEPYDIAFTSNWINNYAQDVAKGAFLPLDDLLAKYAPKTFNSVSKTFWDGARVKGKIYGVINQQITARTPHLAVPKKLAEELHFDINQFSGKLNPDTLNQLEPYVQAGVKANPKRAFIAGFDGLAGDFFNLETISGIHVPGAVDYSDKSLKVVNQFETPQVKKYAALIRDWNSKGYTNSKERIAIKVDPKGTEDTDGFSIGGVFKPGGDIQDSVGAGYPVLEIPTVQPHLATGGIIATMQAISRTSKNPERAMMLLELMNTDQELYNLLNYGIKGKHYDLDADGFKVPGPDVKAYNPNVPWMFATNYLAYVDKGMPKTVWEDSKKFNAEAIPSNLIGFSFDPEPVKAEIGKTSAVFDEYSRAIELGVADEAKYNEFLAKLKAAGSEKIITEMQKQIDAWKASK
jgi:putative aldouronate transport system substrate-binding protein